MTDKTQPEAMRLAEQISDIRCQTEGEARAIAAAADSLCRQHDRIAELEAQLEAVGAGGVSGPLMGRASLSANAGEPRKVFLVATGEEHEGEATYTRYDDKPPPLCDSECLFAAPPTAQAEGWMPIETAPRDGRDVLAYTAGLCRVVVYFDDEESQWDTGLGYLHYDEPTHWTPLPPPPTSAEGVDHG